ncbi:oleate hydratase [Aspergillus foveolatus]|uniref:oleate hydratase n=1 Tax=Aspergillus foveolatus TaxID=210207 RepID=UPI003CCD6B4E
MPNTHEFSRDPNNVQAWLVGSGIASLTTAVHLIREAKVPGPNVHLIDTHKGTGGGMKMQGTEDSGYFLPYECTPHFHGSCVERLLSIIPSPANPEKSILQAVRDRDAGARSTVAANVPRAYDYGYIYPFEASTNRHKNLAEGLFVAGGIGGSSKDPTKHHALLARFVTKGLSGPEVSHHKGVQVGITQRMALVGFLLEHETAIDSKSIKDIFDAAFFETEFWMLWSTTFGLHPWHSAVEFQRHLRKYLGDLRSLDRIREQQRTDYNLVESVVQPLTAFLKQQGVDFRFHQQATDLKAYPEGGPTTISEIEVMTEAGTQELITLDPQDILIVTLGSTTSGAAMGSDTTPPEGLSSNWEEVMDGGWKLWEKLAQKSAKFGNPMNFLPRIPESTVETFTTTFTGPGFSNIYERLTQEKPGTGAFLSLSGSNWVVTISVPHQPVFSTQSENVTVMLGYALNPGTEGNFVKKEMWRCTGQEILKEVLFHLGCCSEDSAEATTILTAAKTIPCGLPLGTAPLLTRSCNDRPPVIPKWTTNIGCVGQFVEIPADSTLDIEYSVNSAQIAVAELMGLPLTPAKPLKSLLREVLNVLI